VTIELARRLEPQTISEMRALATDAVASKFFAVRSPEEALVILMTGHELGLRPMQSLRGIYVVNGKPVLSADMLVAAVRASGACESWRVITTTAERCEIHTRRRGESTDEVGIWTKADAERAGVYRKAGPWQQYPDRMLRHRTASDLARRVYPDVCLGVYVQGELDDDAPQLVTVTHATPLDMLRDDLLSCETAESLRATYAEHSRALAEQDNDGDALRAARDAIHARAVVLGLVRSKADTDRLLGKGTLPVVAQPAPVERVVEVPVAAEPGAVTALREALDVAKSLDAVVTVWRQAGGEVRGLDEGEKFNAWTLAVEAVARINATTCEAADVALRAALAGPKGDGPKGTRKVTTKPAVDAQGAANDAAPSAGTQARAPHPESAPYVAADGAEAWAARVARYTNTIELRRSYERHAPAFRAAGVLEARRAVSVARLQALASIDDEAVAQRVLDDAERAADAAARKPHVPSAGEARRREREAQERAGMREVAQAYAKAS